MARSSFLLMNVRTMGEQYAEQPQPSQQTVVILDTTLRRLAGGFTQLPNFILRRHDLSPGAKITYGLLLSYAWEKEFCYPPQQRLAEESGYSVRQVQRSLDELKTKQLIEWKRQGLGRPNIYYILPILDPAGSEEAKHEELQGDDNMSLLDRTAPEGPEQARGDEHARSDNMSLPDTTRPSSPHTTPLSQPETTPMSYKEDSAKQYSITVPVNGLPGIKNPSNPGLPLGMVDDILNRIAEGTGDSQQGSRRNFRKALYALGQLTIEAILSELRTRAANGEVERGKPQYFMWRCQEEAKKRGFLLWTPQQKSHAASPIRPSATSSPIFNVAALKRTAAVGNQGIMQDLKVSSTEEELST